ncbi:MAG TPA: hypothetical protein VJH06_03810 [Candidatus Paceibacterota bacterium]
MQFRESPQDSNKIFEERSGITPRAMQKGAEQLLTHLRYFAKKAVPDSNFKRIIGLGVAGCLRIRMSAEDAHSLMAKFSSEQLTIFSHLLETSETMYKGLGLKVQEGDGESFTQVSNLQIKQKLYTNKIEDSSGTQPAVQYKEYFTFVPVGTEPNQLLSEAIKFYDALFRAFVRIQEVSRSQNLDIPMKFKNSFLELLMDLDSVVVYVPDPETGKLIRGIINEEMEKQKVKLGRKGRAASGFDMKTEGKEFSHRELIGKVVANEMEKDYKGGRKITNYNIEQVASYLSQQSEIAGKLTPQQVLEII